MKRLLFALMFTAVTSACRREIAPPLATQGPVASAQQATSPVEMPPPAVGSTMPTAGPRRADDRVFNFAWPPLPYPAEAPHRPVEVIRSLYAYAANRPDVLSYIPCYCGCGKEAGHNSVHDCFVKRRDVAGGVVEWDSMGFT